jgi:hypothetical protein
VRHGRPPAQPGDLSGLGGTATGTFPTSVDPVKIRLVATLMQKFGELKQSFNAAALTES